MTSTPEIVLDFTGPDFRHSNWSRSDHSRTSSSKIFVATPPPSRTTFWVMYLLEKKFSFLPHFPYTSSLSLSLLTTFPLIFHHFLMLLLLLLFDWQRVKSNAFKINYTFTSFRSIKFKQCLSWSCWNLIDFLVSPIWIVSKIFKSVDKDEQQYWLKCSAVLFIMYHKILMQCMCGDSTST